MKRLTTTLAGLCFSALAGAEEGKARPDPKPSPDVLEVTPALYNYTTELLFGEVWKRPDLQPRDRSLITLAALLASGQTAQMTGHIKLALDNGVKPGEISGLITHLAFYSGWPNAMSAVGVAKKVFSERGLDPAQINPSQGELLDLDAASESKRRDAVETAVGGTAPELARYTNDVLLPICGAAPTSLLEIVA